MALSIPSAYIITKKTLFLMMGFSNSSATCLKVFTNACFIFFCKNSIKIGDKQCTCPKLTRKKCCQACFGFVLTHWVRYDGDIDGTGMPKLKNIDKVVSVNRVFAVRVGLARKYTKNASFL